jgi:hypothetical protein
MWRIPFFAVLFISSASASEEKAALADCLRLAPDVQLRTRYLEVPASILDADLPEFHKLLTYHVNSLSRRAAPVVLFPVHARLWRLDVREPKWNPQTYEKLKDLDPYHHQKVLLVEVDEVVEYGNWWVGNEKVPEKVPGARWITTERRPTGKKLRKPLDEAKPITGSAPWLDPETMAALVKATQSETPLLRADWFWIQTVRQLDRETNETGTGYYDWLELKSLDDVEKLAGLDVAAARRLERQVAAVIKKSGVAINNRAVFREGAASGGFWRTLDVAGSKDKRNALRLLNGDFVSEAQEIYGVLPNNLFFYAAVNTADRTLQAFVPEKFAGDKETTNEDYRIHPGFSCQRCHVEGLRPLKDWSRKFYSEATSLNSPDYELTKHLQGLYLGPMFEALAADQLVYEQALWRLVQWKPAQAAAAYKAWWKRLAEDDVTGDVFALELGVPHRVMWEAFAAALKKAGRIDPVLGGFLRDPEIPASRAQAEEVFGLAAGYVKGVLP